MVAAKPTPAHPGRVSDERGQAISNPVGWRADVVALIASDADLLEYVRYSSYGVPTSYPKGDYDLDGDVDAADTTALGNFIAGAGGWNLDFNRDGNTDADDTTEHAAYRTGYTGGTGGRGTLSRSGLRNRLGYAGYHWDDTINAYHVRHRVYLPEIGRWTRRDPAGYVDGVAVYISFAGRPVVRRDASGLCVTASCSMGDAHTEQPPPMSCADENPTLGECYDCCRRYGRTPPGSGPRGDPKRQGECEYECYRRFDHTDGTDPDDNFTCYGAGGSFGPMPGPCGNAGANCFACCFHKYSIDIRKAWREHEKCLCEMRKRHRQRGRMDIEPFPTNEWLACERELSIDVVLADSLLINCEAQCPPIDQMAIIVYEQ